LPSSGTVTFFDGTTVLGTAHVNANGQAALVVALGAGKHSLKATFQGDSAFAASTSAAVTETVHRDSTTVAVSPSSDPSVAGQPVTFTATVTPVAPMAGTPTGTVTFFDGSTALGTVTLDANGKAALTTQFATLGNQQIKAVYNGNSNFAASSHTITEQVRTSSKTALVSSDNPDKAGQPVRFTATVGAASGTGTPTGFVTFMDGNVVLAKVPLKGGKATLTWIFPTRGEQSIEAVYSGDAQFAASSQSLNEQVS
jgi:hypothetical protein